MAGGGRERTLEYIGISIPVFQGDTVNIVVMAAAASAFFQAASAFFNLGRGNDLLYPYSMHVSGRLDSPLSSNADGLYNMCVTVGEVY